MKPLLLTGIQPTNRLTLGNYLGAIKRIVKLQEEYRCFLFVADLHALTIPIDHSSLSRAEIESSKLKLAKMYIASGIDMDKSTLFIQSDIKEHLELFYFLITHSVLGELRRMTQYKHLLKKFTNPNGTETALMGLLVYPVLMSADILIYDTDYVSVGEDQIQHLELTRNLAQRINDKYNKPLFKIPDALHNINREQPLRIKDLQNPTKKMSKSCESHEGVIFMDDEPEVIRSKIMKSKTDSLGKISLDEENQPGIVNLLRIHSQIENISLEDSHRLLKDKSYKELKEIVAESTIKELSRIQSNYRTMDDSTLQNILKKNAQQCSKIASEKMKFIFENT